MTRCPFLCYILCSLFLLPLSPSVAEDELIVLMIGDSMTQVVLDDLSGFSNASLDWEVFLQVFNISESASLLDAFQAEGPSIIEALNADQWDYVVVQERNLLPSIAGLSKHPEWYDDQMVPEAILAEGESFWQSGETVGQTILSSSNANLTLFPIWPRAAADEDLLRVLPDPRPAAMAMLTSEAQQAWLEDLRTTIGKTDRLLFAPLNAAWFHALDQLGLDLYAEDPVLAGPAGRYLAAASLFRVLTGATLADIPYSGTLESTVAQNIRSTVDSLLGQPFILPEVAETEDPQDEHGETPEEEEIEPEPTSAPELPPLVGHRYLLVGGGDKATLISHLQGFFNNDPAVYLELEEQVTPNDPASYDHILFLPDVDTLVLAALEEESNTFLADGQAIIEQHAVAQGPPITLLTPWPKTAEQEAEVTVLTQLAMSMLLRQAQPGLRQGWFDAPRPPSPNIALDSVVQLDLIDLWRRARLTLPELDFYGDDPAVDPMPGQYTIAARLFAHLTQRDVTNQPYQGMLTADQARALRELATQAANPPSKTRTIPSKVLVLGNDVTTAYANDLLGFLGKEAKVVLRTQGEASLEAFHANGLHRAEMVTTDWDTVILQASLTSAAYATLHARELELFENGAAFDVSTPAKDFRIYVELLARHALVGTETDVVLVASWPFEDGHESLAVFSPNANAAQMQTYTNEAYERIALTLNNEFPGRVQVAYVGNAWLRDPEIDLYSDDPEGGNALGHYLAAAVLYESLSHQSPADHPYIGSFSESTAAYLRQLADFSREPEPQLADRSIMRVVAPILAEEAILSENLNTAIDEHAPRVLEGPFPGIFEAYDTSGPSTWANNWTQALDFSGVAWDQAQAGTLITDRFILLARHFTRTTGSEVRFTDRNGEHVVRTIIGQDFASFDSFALRTDITVALLDSAVPDTVAVYPILSGDIDPEILLGSKLISTYKNRTVGLSVIKKFDLFSNDSEVVTTRANPDLIDSSWDRLTVHGDSGHPSFLIVDGQLTLLSTHTFVGPGTKGPYFGGPGNQDKIQRIMDDLLAAEIGS